MKLDDAPPAGWYPDPEHRGRLRWWDGLDWSEERRVSASSAETANAIRIAAEARAPELADRGQAEVRASQLETRQLVSQMRVAAREEADLAGQMLARRATGFIEQVRSVVIENLTPVVRWIRIGVVVAALLVIVWFVIQFIAQVTLLNWLGDRIDSVISR